ncbi:MAG: LTA synthase family protein [Alistipes senegalensis]|nr:LTA synthase family protein [Bacteroides cellulosilyticus]MCM1352291.1 LTA synthase family protein [Alistipes senegalensis]
MKNEQVRFLAGIFARLATLTLAVGFVLRIVLLFNAQTSDIGFSFGEWLQVFLLGALNDLCIAVIGSVPLWAFLVSVSDAKYRRPFGYIVWILLLAAFCNVTFSRTIFDEYGSVVPQIASGIFGFWALSFALRLFLPMRFRRTWTTVWLGIFLFVYVGAILCNGICEYVFWSEFGVRYNFIAVDYLVYTHEVIGNIVESYPIGILTAGLLAVTAVVAWWLFRYTLSDPCLRSGRWNAVALLWVVPVAVAVWLVGFNVRFQNSTNVYVNELQANGAYKFYDAFVKNELAYERFYPTLPQHEAEAFVHSVYGSSEDNRHAVVGSAAEIRRNIVLITMESMSASYMERFGDTRGLTPVLDSLYRCGLAFDRVYAVGNRTVRGLEALSLSLPPCPGQSIVKRPNNGGMHSVGALLREKGYRTLYFYGGNSYFDNMGAFFSGNGYEVIDKSDYAPDEITFANIWGVCDEDAYRKAIRELGRISDSGAPFFAHLMTVSNHRPFTYPETATLPPPSKTRAGGVAYSDYALGRFFAEAAQQEWFDNTIFLICADHCASSAGRTEIPLEKYHIPALIFAPGFVEPRTVAQTVSQIDLVPTLLALLHFSYDSHFYGRDVLADDYVPRAFIATYQDLGYLEDDVLTLLSPVRRVKQYRHLPTEEDPFRTVLQTDTIPEYIDRAIAFYQTSDRWNSR